MTGHAFLNVYKNGVSYALLGCNYSSASVNGVSGSVLISLAAADYIDVRVHQVSGGAEALSSVAADNNISITRVLSDI
jgi:hypothetical protein